MEISKNPILKELVYDAPSGALVYKGVRYLLIRPETLAGFQKAVHERCGKAAAESLFDGGYTGGRLSAEKYRELHNFSDLEIIEFMMNMGGQIGWGHFRLERYDPEAKDLRVCVLHSPFAQAYGKSSAGVCHLIRGVLAGMAAALFGGSCTSEEVECRAKGEERCLFVIRAQDET